MKKLELVDQKFGKLLVKREAGRDKSKNVLWECECECGNKTIVYGFDLMRGVTKSCGCLQKELSTKHGLYGTPTYRSWTHMIQRCNNPNSDNYGYYGGRGITVCNRWLKFESFYEDMGERPNGLTIERINNEKGYYLGNCKWALLVEQSRNKRLYKNNKTGCAGVCYHRSRKKYVVVIPVNHRNVHIGYFEDKQDAITARKQAEQKYWS